MISPELSILDYIYKYIQDNITENVYTAVLQGFKSNIFPFVEIGAVHGFNTTTSDKDIDIVAITINVWTEQDDYGTAYDITNQISNISKTTFTADGYTWFGQEDRTDKQVMIDDSTEKLYNHGIVNIQFKTI